VEDPVNEADAGGFVGVLIWYFDVDLPVAAGEGRYDVVPLARLFLYI
jgi:hypothetical protein